VTGKSSPREKFGERAVRMGFATEEQVREALELQRSPSPDRGQHELIGLILLKMGALTNDQLIKVLKTYAAESDDVLQ
jgi:hypothetical protein